MTGLRRVGLFIDGINTKTLGLFEQLKPYMDYYTAKDIKGMEVMASVKYRIYYDPESEDGAQSIMKLVEAKNHRHHKCL